MKHDKSGAAAVIAAARTVARLAPETPLMAVAPMVENMPGGNAQRPGDVVKAMNGKTIEVIEHRRRGTPDPGRCAALGGDARARPTSSTSRP